MSARLYHWLLFLSVVAMAVIGLCIAHDRDAERSRRIKAEQQYTSLVADINHRCVWDTDGHATCEVGAFPTTTTTVPR